MRVFVDTCIYNDFLQARGVNLDILRTFRESINQKKFKLIFPKVTQEEIYRGVPQEFKGKLLPFTMPPVPAGVEETEIYKETEKLLKNLNSNLSEIEKEKEPAIKKLMNEYIEEFIKQAEDIQEDETIIKAAELRRSKRNPPGKNEYLGDEIVWELILNKFNDDDLVIVSHDIDWRYGEKKLHPFLEKEWKEKSTKKIELFLSINLFLQSIEPKSKKAPAQPQPSIQTRTLPLTYTVDGRIVASTSPSKSLVSLGSVQPLTLGTISPSATLSISDIVSCIHCGEAYAKTSALIISQGLTVCPYCGELNS